MLNVHCNRMHALRVLLSLLVWCFPIVLSFELMLILNTELFSLKLSSYRTSLKMSLLKTSTNHRFSMNSVVILIYKKLTLINSSISNNFQFGRLFGRLASWETKNFDHISHITWLHSSTIQVFQKPLNGRSSQFSLCCAHERIWTLLLGGLVVHFYNIFHPLRNLNIFRLSL